VFFEAPVLSTHHPAIPDALFVRGTYAAQLADPADVVETPMEQRTFVGVEAPVPPAALSAAEIAATMFGSAKSEFAVAQPALVAVTAVIATGVLYALFVS
jgi:hypothetical protein